MIEIPAQVKEDLEKINAVAEDLKMKLYVVGGFPRDIVSGKGIDDETDLDVTEGYGNGFDLAFFVSAKYNLQDPIVYDRSGTALVVMPSGRPVEFHNAGWDAPHIIDQLYVMNVKPTPLNRDIYTRDFTINTLLFDPSNGKIIDITGRGISDIQNRILTTPLNPKKTLKIKPDIVLRGIRFKIQLNLTEDPEYTRELRAMLPNFIQYLKENKDSKSIKNTLKKTLKIDPKRAVEEYKRLGILEFLPSEIEIENVIKEDMFGTTITPVSLTSSSQKKSVEAQSKMLQRLIEEREKHKAYMRRKKREDLQDKKEMLKILERADEGYYLHNPEPDFVKDRKIDKNRRLFQYITNRDYDNDSKQ